MLLCRGPWYPHCHGRQGVYCGGSREIAQFIYSNPDRRISIPEIADRCSFSPFYRNRLFRSVVEGESIYEFEKRVRLGRAAAGLLKDHGASVTEIAYGPERLLRGGLPGRWGGRDLRCLRLRSPGSGSSSGSLSPVSRFVADAVPATLSTLLVSSVTLVDGLFVGRFVGSAVLAGVNLTVPVLYGFMDVAIMIAVGGSRAVSPLFGMGKNGEAARIRTASLLYLTVVSIVFAPAVFLLRGSLAAFLGARDEIGHHPSSYLSVICLAYPASMTIIGLTVFLRGAGEPVAVLASGSSEFVDPLS